MKNIYKTYLLMLSTIMISINIFFIAKHYKRPKEQKKTFPQPVFLINETLILNDDKTLISKNLYPKNHLKNMKKLVVAQELLKPSPARTILLERIFNIPKDLFDEYEIHYKEDHFFVFTPKSSQTPPFSIITDNKTESIKTIQKKIELIVGDIISKNVVKKNVKSRIEIDTRFKNRFIAKIIL